jgi:hypothetical protein
MFLVRPHKAHKALRRLKAQRPAYPLTAIPLRPLPHNIIRRHVRMKGGALYPVVQNDEKSKENTQKVKNIVKNNLFVNCIMEIAKNGTVGATSGALPGWISSIVSLALARNVVPDQTNYLLVASVPFGWICGLAGGFVGGAIGGKNAARNGVIGGTLVTPALCAAIIVNEKWINRKGA